MLLMRENNDVGNTLYISLSQTKFLPGTPFLTFYNKFFFIQFV